LSDLLDDYFSLFPCMTRTHAAGPHFARRRFLRLKSSILTQWKWVPHSVSSFLWDEDAACVHTQDKHHCAAVAAAGDGRPAPHHPPPPPAAGVPSPTGGGALSLQRSEWSTTTRGHRGAGPLCGPRSPSPGGGGAGGREAGGHVDQQSPESDTQGVLLTAWRPSQKKGKTSVFTSNDCISLQRTPLGGAPSSRRRVDCRRQRTARSARSNPSDATSTGGRGGARHGGSRRGRLQPGASRLWCECTARPAVAGGEKGLPGVGRRVAPGERWSPAPPACAAGSRGRPPRRPAARRRRGPLGGGRPDAAAAGPAGPPPRRAPVGRCRARAGARPRAAPRRAARTRTVGARRQRCAARRSVGRPTRCGRRAHGVGARRRSRRRREFLVAGARRASHTNYTATPCGSVCHVRSSAPRRWGAWGVTAP